MVRSTSRSPRFRTHALAHGALVAGVLLAGAPAVAAAAAPAPTFESTGADRAAIERLLGDYTRAVSTKNEALFKTLILDRDVPFAGVGSRPVASESSRDTRQFGDFEAGVFSGAPFTQRFRDVHILQDGRLAQVSLVFENTTPQSSSWGWKTMQLLKVGDGWKIASEFYTGHPGAFPPAGAR